MDREFVEEGAGSCSAFKHFVIAACTVQEVSHLDASGPSSDHAVLAVRRRHTATAAITFQKRIRFINTTSGTSETELVLRSVVMV